MALVNEILVGRFNRILQRFTGIKNTQAAVPQLAPEIQPSIDLAAMPPELRWLGTEKLCVFGNATGSGAAQLAYAQVGVFTFGTAASPSPVMVVIEELWISNLAGAATEFEIGISNLSTRAAQQAQVRDVRANPLSVAFGVNARCTSGPDAAGDGVAILAQPARFNMPAAPTQPIRIAIPYIITPSPANGFGRAFTVRAITANQAFSFGIVFRERFLEESEFA